jgi:hypothetical protein
MRIRIETNANLKHWIKYNIYVNHKKKWNDINRNPPDNILQVFAQSSRCQVLPAIGIKTFKFKFKDSEKSSR